MEMLNFGKKKQDLVTMKSNGVATIRKKLNQLRQSATALLRQA